MPHTAYISIGSNLGDRVQNCTEALEMLHERGDIEVTKVSSWYESAAIDADGHTIPDAPLFLNGAASIETDLSSHELLDALMDVEVALGRPRRRKKGRPRTVDLDLLLYATEIKEDKKLTLPHPSMRKRLFVLKPLYDIAPNAVDPLTGETVKDILEECIRKHCASEVKKFREVLEDSEGE